MIVTLWDLATAFGVGMLNPRRAAMMHAAAEWLGRNRMDVMATGGAYPLVLRRDLVDQPTTLLGLFIAIPAIAAYNILRNRISRLVLEVGILSEGLMSRFENLGGKK